MARLEREPAGAGAALASDTFTGTPGRDVVFALDEGYRTVFGLGGDDELRVRGPDHPGNESATVELYGGDGNDLITGSGVIRIVADGGAGGDRISASAEAVTVDAGSGNDQVVVRSSGASVRGGDGNDLLDVVSFPNGGFVDGGAGNDTLFVGGSLDEAERLVARGGTGDDRISAEPGGGTRYHGIDANGGAGRDVLTGSDDAEFGDDLLYGGQGNDTISGRRGDDKLGGDGGVDTLTGGIGADTFDFNQGGSGVGAGRRDVVTDFIHGQDTLDLLSIDANAGRAGDQAFAFVGTRGFTGAGQVRFARVDGNTVVQGSTDGDAAAEFEILLDGKVTPTADDFAL